MHAEMCKSICARIIRYCQRGFLFLEPRAFDNAWYTDIMARSILDEKREETREEMNDDGEMQTVTVTYYPSTWPCPNVDPYRLQETFIHRICCEKFE